MFAKSVRLLKGIIQPKKEKENRFPAKRGYRQDLGIELKSSMEANLMRFYLQRCKWDNVLYEPEIFHFVPKDNLEGKARVRKADPSNIYDIRGYIPDFKLVRGKTTVYIEAKGYMDRLALEKARLFKKNYPWLRLYFVTWDKYKLIEKHYKSKIRYWE